MAVSNIRKISSSVLLTIVVLAVLTIIAFFVGGYVDPTALKPEPKFTDLLLYFTYAVFIFAVIVLIGFAIVGFAGKFKSDPKGALSGLGALIGLIILLGITYAVGSADKLSLGSSAQTYNTDFYLKFSDMWLYSIYVLFGLTVLALIWGAIRSAFAKKAK
ncbi:MAG: alkaline shock response membrane anchor protein AmaP [Bacteroidales bacterium]|nr:alkaline shock response membrane anchor protein AmaP [Bacteroidales bacterium]